MAHELGEGVEEIHLRLTIDVVYETRGAKKKELAHQLYGVADHAATSGMFLGEAVAFVDSWRAKVEEIESISHD